MKRLVEPVRLSESATGGGAEPLARAIHELRSADGSSAEVARLARRIAPQLATPPVPAPTAIAPAGLGLSASGKLWLLALLAVIGASVWLRAAVERPATRERPRAVAAASGSTAAERAPGRGEAPTAVPPAPVAAPSSAVEVSDRAVRAPRAPAAAQRRATAPAANAPEAELVLLQRTQSALERDPAAALALAEQHARDYPGGVFAQEREVLAIEALLGLRRKPAALARAERFTRRFPDSPHARRVRGLLERSSSSTNAAIRPPADDSSENLQP